MRILVVEGEDRTMVYCQDRGAVAGVPTECMCWNSYSFASATVAVICKGCGAVPGPPTRCKVWHAHSFAPIPEDR